MENKLRESLSSKSCTPCQGGVAPLSKEKTNSLLNQLNNWMLVNNHHLTKTYTFPDFLHALAWVNKIGALAEQEGHHPDLYLSWGKVSIEIWTHKIDGLTESDFVLAAKIDKL